jgi:hypothetical protein
MRTSGKCVTRIVLDRSKRVPIEKVSNVKEGN